MTLGANLGWPHFFFTRRCPILVLSRKKNERIVINASITIVVVEIRGDKVRLGIEAPKDVPVHRQEVLDAIAGGKQRKARAEQGASLKERVRNQKSEVSKE